MDHYEMFGVEILTHKASKEEVEHVIHFIRNYAKDSSSLKCGCLFSLYNIVKLLSSSDPKRYIM